MPLTARSGLRITALAALACGTLLFGAALFVLRPGPAHNADPLQFEAVLSSAPPAAAAARAGARASARADLDAAPPCLP